MWIPNFTKILINFEEDTTTTIPLWGHGLQTTSTSSSYQNQIKNQLQILNRITAEDTWGKSPVDKELLFQQTTTERDYSKVSPTTRFGWGRRPRDDQSSRCTDLSSLLFQLLVSAPPGSISCPSSLLSSSTRTLRTPRTNASRLHRAWRGFKPNVAENPSQRIRRRRRPRTSCTRANPQRGNPGRNLEAGDTTAWYDALTAGNSLHPL